MSLDADGFQLQPGGIERDEAEYILSSFKGIHDDRTLFSG